MRRPKIVVTDHRFDEIHYEEEILRPLGGELILKSCSNEEELIELVHDADGVLNSSIPLSRNVIEKMERCKIIAYYGTGVDGIDLAAASGKGIFVSNVIDYCTQEVAEHVIAIILAHNRRLFFFNSQVHLGNWQESLPQPIHSLEEKKLGIYGYGRIAQAVSEKARALGMKVLVSTRREISSQEKIRKVDFASLVRESDFISVQTALTPETRLRFSEREFRLMKPHAYFINTARGGIVDEDALFRAISEKWISGAALDVTSLEPPDPSNKLLKLESVLITPHVGWYSQDSNKRLRESAAKEVLRVLQGEVPCSAVNYEAVTGKPDNVIRLNSQKNNGVSQSPEKPRIIIHDLKKAPIRVSEYIVQCLEKVGVEQIFGVPGGSLSPLYRAIEGSRIKDVLAKHEGGAAFMADGYARVSGRLGVCMATTGPGTTNLITGVSSAFADSIPILVLTGQVSTDYFGKGASQESSPESLDIVQIFKQVTRYSGLAFKASQVPRFLRKALMFATQGRTGPVHLSIPSDVFRDEIDSPPFFEKPNSPSSLFDREEVRSAATWLLRAKRPAILLGHGCILGEAWDEARRLAELLRIPVVTTPKAKGALPEDHLLSLGCFGFSGSPLAEWYLSSNQVDVLLAVGTSFNEWGTNGWKKELNPFGALLQIDIDPREMGKNYPVMVPMVGNAKTVLKELLYEIRRQQTWFDSPKDRDMAEVFDTRSRLGMMKNADSMKSNSSPVKPQRVMADLRASLPPDALVFVDGGANRSWATHYFQSLAPRTFFSATGMASMGYGVAAAVGAKFAAPDQMVVSVVGDGGFMMNGMEVATAVAYNKPVIWVVLNDGRYGMIYHGRRILGYPTNSSEYPQCDIASVAEGLGARGIKIREPGEINPRLIRDISESGVPTVLDVYIDSDEIPPISSRVSSLRKGFSDQEMTT